MCLDFSFDDDDENDIVKEVELGSTGIYNKKPHPNHRLDTAFSFYKIVPEHLFLKRKVWQ